MPEMLSLLKMHKVPASQPARAARVNPKGGRQPPASAPDTSRPPTDRKRWRNSLCFGLSAPSATALETPPAGGSLQLREVFLSTPQQEGNEKWQPGVTIANRQNFQQNFPVNSVTTSSGQRKFKTVGFFFPSEHQCPSNFLSTPNRPFLLLLKNDHFTQLGFSPLPPKI